MLKMKTLLDALVRNKELYDLTPVCSDVFGDGVSCFVAANLYEILEFYSRDLPAGADDAFTVMLQDIKAACADEGIEGVTGITGYVSDEQEVCFYVVILGLPNFYVYVFPVAELKALLIGDNAAVVEYLAGEIRAGESE